MAALATTHPTLLDLKTRLDPDGSIASIVDILDQTNEIVADMVFSEANGVADHTTTIRTGLPTPTWRKLYGGVQPTKSTTVQVKDGIGMLQAYAEVDVDLAKLNGNEAAFRMSEDRPHIEGMAQEAASTIMYGNSTTEPEAFTGFAPRFNSLSAANADNIINAGGTGSDNASIWLVVWGPNTCHGIVPKGSVTGLQSQDLGEVTIEDVDGAGGRMQAYRTHYKWHMGLVVRDWRYIVRICNIDKSDLSRVYTAGNVDSGALLPDLMFQAMRLVPNLNAGRPAFYMSRDIATWVSRQTLSVGQGGLITSDRVTGDMRFTERFHGIPMRRVDALAANEAQVT